MTNLEQLVPPFELCRKIPDEAFNDSALVWWWFKAQNRPVLSPRNIMKHAVEELVPAPTAQEILEALPNYCLSKENPDTENKFSSRVANGISGITRKKLPEMLLFAWLMFKGIKPNE